MVDVFAPTSASAVMYSATVSGVAGIGVSPWSVHHMVKSARSLLIGSHCVGCLACPRVCPDGLLELLPPCQGCVRGSRYQCIHHGTGVALDP